MSGKYCKQSFVVAHAPCKGRQKGFYTSYTLGLSGGFGGLPFSYEGNLLPPVDSESGV
jgi:hypothetical protein